MFLRKDVLKMCSKFTGDHPCRSAISIKLLIEIALRHGYSPENLVHIFRTPFLNNTSGRLLLSYANQKNILKHLFLGLMSKINNFCNSNIADLKFIPAYIFLSSLLFSLFTSVRAPKKICLSDSLLV